MNLAGTHPRMIWYAPQISEGDSDGGASILDLIPDQVTWIVLQLCLVVVLLGLWQGRRIGPLVAEQLPVVVRASETVEGRGRLYRSRRARDRAAEALRTAALQRMLPRLGLGPDAAAARRRAGRRRSAAASTRRRWRTRCSVRRLRTTTIWSTSPANSTTSKGRSHIRDSATHGQSDARRTDAARNALLALRTEIAKAVVGQDAVVSGLVIALLCRGHVLLEGVPGVAKTLLVRTLAAALQLEFKRVQFTPDLMPGDVTGSLVYDARTAEFEFRSGPVFTNLLLADEINRTPPKTQAALLEAMEERQVSVDGVPAPAARPVHRRRDAEPDRIRGHLPTARGAARPVPAQAQRAAAAARPGDRDPRPARPRLRPSRPVRGATRRGPRRAGGGTRGGAAGARRR